MPLVPAAIKGTEQLLRLSQLKVAYGKPIPVQEFAGLPPKDASDALTERLMAEIQALYESL